MDTSTTLLEAMARKEGWLVPTSRCRRNHNPGNIEYGKFAIAHGAIGADSRFAIFRTDEDGFNAMRALLLGAYKGLTLEQAITRWAPPTENNTAQYIKDVCSWTKLDPKTKIEFCLNLI